MKPHTHFTLFILLNSMFCAIRSQHPTFIIHNHITGSSARATTETDFDFDQKNNMLSMPNVYDDFKKNIPIYYNLLFQHKYKITAGLFCTSFICTQYKIYTTHKMLESPVSWCNWKATASTQQLASASRDELTPELINDIQKKYLLKSKMTSCRISTPPFDQFIKDLSQELELLEWYRSVQKVTKIMHISKCFYFHHKKSFILEKINRIHIMLDIFINWQTKDFLK